MAHIVTRHRTRTVKLYTLKAGTIFDTLDTLAGCNSAMLVCATAGRRPTDQYVEHVNTVNLTNGNQVAIHGSTSVIPLPGAAIVLDYITVD